MASSGNADFLEISRFNDISDRWWDQAGEMRTLHVINPLRLQFISENNSLENLKILDVGCGGGILAEALAKAGAQVTGIDLSLMSISVATQHAQSNGLKIDYHVENVEQFTQQHAQSFDMVTCMEMLEHVPQPERIVAACAKAAKPGGQVYFSTINRTVKSFLFAILAGEYVLHLLPTRSHRYDRLIRPGELKEWSGMHNLVFIRLASLIYNPLTGNFKLQAHKEDVNYLAQFTKKN